MNLFEIDENDYVVKLNRPWIYLIPEFTEVMKKDKGGTVGDQEGKRKWGARKRFAYIYFYLDFTSPISNWDDESRETESLNYTGLTKKDISEEYMKIAMTKYKQLQLEAARSLRTLKAAKIGLDAMDDYFENIDFTKTDKMGKILHSPKEYITNLTLLNKAYNELATFEKRVMDDLKKAGGIRGTATMGDKESGAVSTKTPDGEWKEGGGENEESVSNFVELGEALTQKEK